MNSTLSRWSLRGGLAALGVSLTLALAPSVVWAEGPRDQPGASDVGKGGKAARKDKASRKVKKGRKGRGGPLKAVGAYYQDHRRLADAYMLTGQYGKALQHYQAIIDYTPDPAKLAAQRGGAADEVEAPGRKGREGRGGPRGRLHRVKVEAYLGAAACSHKKGDAAGAKRFAEAGLSYADANHLDRAVELFERFLADPAAGTQRVAPGAAELEAELEATRKELP